jgi:hypothetical protein
MSEMPQRQTRARQGLSFKAVADAHRFAAHWRIGEEDYQFETLDIDRV